MHSAFCSHLYSVTGVVRGSSSTHDLPRVITVVLAYAQCISEYISCAFRFAMAGLLVYLLQWGMIFKKGRYMENHNKKSDTDFSVGRIWARAKICVQGPTGKKDKSGDIIEKNPAKSAFIGVKIILQIV